MSRFLYYKVEKKNIFSNTTGNTIAQTSRIFVQTH